MAGKKAGKKAKDLMDVSDVEQKYAGNDRGGDVQHDDTDWVYGTYRDHLIIVPRGRADECLENLQILSLVVNSANWDEVLTQYSVDQVESAIGSYMDSQWWNQEDEPDEERQPGQLPDIAVLQEFGDARSYAPDLLDDGEILGYLLPAEVMEHAQWPETGPMTEYEPCYWDENSLPEIRAIAARHGATLTEDQTLISAVEAAYFSC